jgi:mxaD protein
MRRSFLLAAAVLLLAPIVTQAQTPLNVYQTIDIAAPASKVWGAVKNWDNLHGWHPAFASTELISGQNDVVGAMRRLTLKDGPSFEEELTGFDASAMKFRYKIIGEAPLPITDYDSTMQVLSTGPGKSAVVWRGSFFAKPGAESNVVMESVTQLYLGGLQNLKQMIESR